MNVVSLAALAVFSAGLVAACGDDTTPGPEIADTAEPEVEELSCSERAPVSCDAKVSGGEGTPLELETRDCWTVKIDRHTITVTDRFGTGTFQAWGNGASSNPAAPPASGTAHENLNGKHLKDFDGTRRTLLLDGATITMRTDPEAGGVVTTFIYDGERGWGFDNLTNTITTELVGAEQVAVTEAAEADGEAARLRSISPGCGLRADNVYYEEEGEDGTPEQRRTALSVFLESGGTPVTCGEVEEGAVPLGYTPGEDNPKQIYDCYDDPRLGNT